MTRDITLITAKRYIALLKKHELPVLAAWLFSSHEPGKELNDGVISIAVVLDPFEATPENHLILNQLRLEIDEHIELHPFNKIDFDTDNPLAEVIRTEGIGLK